MWAGAHEPERVRLTVINNHSEFRTPGVDGLRVLHNTTRPDRAWGNLARDWNAGLLDAFGDHGGSDVEWCVLAQNDIDWLPDWQRRLDGLHQGLQFFSQPRGDQSMGFRLPAVREVGFFDERFSTIAFQEQDYFTRAAVILGERASSNDDQIDGRMGLWNPHEPVLNEASFHGYDITDPLLHTTSFKPELARLLCHKWCIPEVQDIFDRRRMLDRVLTGLVAMPEKIDWYPYFWKGRGAPHRSAGYLTAWPHPSRSYAIVEDDGDRLLQLLARVAELDTGVPTEVLIDCRDEVFVTALRSQLSGDVAFCPAPADLSSAERTARLTHLARGAEVATVSGG